LDVSRAELLRAPSASYDEIVVADATEPTSELEGRFDLVVSWFALEHLRPLRGAVHNLRSYLRPGGRFVAYCSGRLAIASLLNRTLPRPISGCLLRRFSDRAEESIHRAYYDQCTYSALRALFADGWERSEVVPRYTGGKYFRFSRPLHAIYLCYEESIYRADKRNLAPYFLIDATADRVGEQQRSND
jgi:SAM-dependent methyltransferase